jgi:hypothetical protein
MVYRKEGTLQSLKFGKMEIWKQTQGEMVYIDVLL